VQIGRFPQTDCTSHNVATYSPVPSALRLLNPLLDRRLLTAKQQSLIFHVAIELPQHPIEAIPKQSHGPEPMSNKKLARRETPQDTLHFTVSECTGNPGSAAVTLPDCNCGSVGSRRLRMINRAVIDFKSQSLKKEQAWETRVARKTRKRTSNSS